MGKKKKQSRQEVGTDSVCVDADVAPPPEPRPRGAAAASIVLRHLIPLAFLLFLGGSAAQFLLLNVFNIAFTIMGIGTLGVSVSMRDEMRSFGLANEISSWGTLLAINIVGSLVLTGLFGWVLALAVSSLDEGGLFTKSLCWSLLAIVVCAGPEMFRQYRLDVASKLSEQQRKLRDQPIVFIHLLCGGFIFILSGYAFELGRAGFAALALLVTAMFVFRDLRPDLMRQLAPRGPG